MLLNVKYTFLIIEFAKITLLHITNACILETPTTDQATTGETTTETTSTPQGKRLSKETTR